MMQDFNQQENFFTGLNKDLKSYFNVKKESLSSEDHSLLYPLQEEMETSGTRYVDDELIGQGGKKFIYKVKDTKTGRPVAKAVLRAEENADYTEQFLCEARLTSLLQHPNIISVYDMGIEAGGAFFTMELLKGDTLSDIIKKLRAGEEAYLKKYPETVLLEFFSRVCDAMAYAHSKNIVHLDLKPGNIQIGEFGEVHVCDWGMAKVITDDEEEFEFEDIADLNEFNNMTLSGVIKGTPGYMAPEQCVSQGIKDARTDIYALGAILYSILTYSISVSQSESIKMMLDQTINGSVIPPGERRASSDISKSLEAIVMKSLKREPTERYQTINDLRADLASYMRGYATSAENAGFLTHLILLVKRHGVISSLIAGFMIIIVVLTLTFIREIQTKEQNAVKARIDAVDAREEAVEAHEEAEHALILVKQEAVQKEKLYERVSKILLSESHFKGYHDKKYKITVMDSVLNNFLYNKKSKDLVLFRKGVLHFIHQEFSQAEKCFAESSRVAESARIPDLASEYAQLKSDDEILSDKELSKIIWVLQRWNRNVSFSLYESHMRRLEKEGKAIDPVKHFPLVRAMLGVANNCWSYRLPNSRLKKVTGGYSLDLSGTRYSEYHFSPITKRNFFSALQLVSLDLSNSSFRNYSELYGLKGLKKLALSGCHISQIDGWFAVKLQELGLEEITFSHGQLSDESLRNVREHIQKVIILPQK